MESTASYELSCDFWKITWFFCKYVLLSNEPSLHPQKVNFVKVKLGLEFDSFSSTELFRTTKGWRDHAGHTSALHCLSNRSNPSTVVKDLCQERYDFLNPFMLLKQNIMNQIIFRVEMHFLFTKL